MPIPLTPNSWMPKLAKVAPEMRSGFIKSSIYLDNWSPELKQSLKTLGIEEKRFQQAVIPELLAGRNSLIRGKLHGALAGLFFGLAALPVMPHGLPTQILQGLGVGSLLGTAHWDALSTLYATKGGIKMAKLSSLLRESWQNMRTST